MKICLIRSTTGERIKIEVISQSVDSGEERGESSIRTSFDSSSFFIFPETTDRSLKINNRYLIPKSTTQKNHSMKTQKRENGDKRDAEEISPLWNMKFLTFAFGGENLCSFLDLTVSNYIDTKFKLTRYDNKAHCVTLSNLTLVFSMYEYVFN